MENIEWDLDQKDGILHYTNGDTRAGKQQRVDQWLDAHLMELQGVGVGMINYYEGPVEEVRVQNLTKGCGVKKRRLNKARAYLKIRKMIEELKSKDRIISQLERQLGHSATAGQVPSDKWSPQAPAQKSSPLGETTHDKDLLFQTCGKNGSKDSIHSENGLASNAFHLPPIEDTGDKKRVAARVPSLEKCLEDEKRRTHALTEKNAILMKRLSEMERRSKPLQDRSKKYVEKSMELTSVKRCLEDQLTALSEENKRLKEQCEQSRLKLSHVTRQLTQERSDKEGLEDQTSEIEDLCRQLTEQNKTIAALKQMCSEKDRRIELIQYRKRRRRQERSQEMLAGVKETAYGYDEDNQSVDSEVSSLSFDNSLEDDSWDEFGKEEFQENYRRLAREHLDLEKSYALLQSHSDMYQDPQRENKSRSDMESDLFKAQCKIENLEKFLKLSGKDSNWLVEKQTLQAENRELDNRVKELEQIEHHLRQELEEAHEREEELEFKFLELEGSDDGEIPGPLATSSPDKNRLTSGMQGLEEVLMEAKHQGIDFQDLLQQLEEVRNDMDIAGSDQSKLALLKAHAFLGILDKTLKNSKSFGNEPSESSTWQNTSHRDDRLPSSPTTTTTPAILSSQDVSKEDGEEEKAGCSCGTDLTTQLTTAQKRIVKLENVFQDLNKAVEVYKDKLSMANSARERDREVMESLKAQIHRLADDPSIGSQVLRERLEKLEQAEKRADDLEKTAWELQSKVIGLQQDKHSLEERLEGSEHGRVIILAEDAEVQEEMEKLRAKVSSFEKSETELMEKNLSLEKAIHKSRTENSELTSKVDGLTDQIQQLKVELDRLSKRHDISDNQEEAPETFGSLREEIAHLQSELEEKNSEINHLKNLLLDGDVLEQIRQLGQEMGVIKEENITLRNQLREKGSAPGDERLSSLILNPKGDNSSKQSLEDLQQDLDNANSHIEQLKKKLRLAEDTINDLESSEGELRDNLEVTEKKEVDYRKKIGSYQKTIRELRDQLADRDLVEESLQEKLNSMVDLEAAQAKRIAELESIEASLQHRLELKDQVAVDFDLVASLESTVETLRSKNRELEEKVEELEESEATLKKNWQAVAEEDTSRIMHLEEKVRTLDLTNHQLKNKLREDEADAALIDEIVFSPISSGPKTGSRSESNLNMIGRESSPSDLSAKVEELENRLQLVSEEKNSKIESLQEKLDVLRETEIKLSETVFEMEQEEKHLRAKLALYENSVVTVENMARYEEKLEEMKNSEHDLLNRMNSLENREYDLKDKLEETEMKYKSEVDKLERNISNYQKLEEKLLDKIHDLETKNKELEKKSKQPRSSGRDVSHKSAPNPETERQLNDLRTRVRELRAKVSSLEKQNKELKEKLACLNTEREELLANNNKLISRLSDLEYLEKKVEVLQDAEAKFLERVCELEQENSQLEQQLRASQKESSSVNVKQENVNKTSSALFEKNQQLEEENQSLSLLVQRQSKMQVDGEALREKVALLEKAEDKLMERVMELEQSEELLKAQLARAEKAASVLPELQDKLDTKDDATDSLQNALQEWQEKYSKLREEMATLESLRTEDKHKITMLLETEENLTEALTTQKKRERELEEDLEASEERIDELQLKVQRLQEDCDQLRSELKDLEENSNEGNIEDLQAELVATQEKLEEIQTEYEQTIGELENKGREQREEYEGKICELKDAEKITKQILQQETAVKVNDLHAKIDEVSLQLEKQLELNRTREEVNQKLTNENAQQREKISQLEMLVDALKSLQPESESQSKASAFTKDNLMEAKSEPKRFQSTFSFTFQPSTVSDQTLSHQESFENRTAEGSETESQTHVQTGNISQDSSLDELLQERERLLIEIEELKHALDQTQAQSERLQKITIEETKSEFITKEIIYRAKVDQLSGKLDKDSTSSRHNKSNSLQEMAALRDTVDELQKREALYCREIESMRNNFHQLRQSAQLPKGPVIHLPHKKYSEMTQKELLETVHMLEGEQKVLRKNLEELNEQFVTFREALDEITACLREEVLDGSPGSRGDSQGKKTSTLHQKFSDLAQAEAELQDRINFLKFSGLATNSSFEEKQNLSPVEYETLVMELREKVDSLQEKESRLKRRLYEKSGIGPNTQVRKLYDRIIDLEASESRLQRKVEYLRLSEEDLHRRLAAAQKLEPSTTKKSVLLTSVLPKRDSQKEELQITIQQFRKNESSLNRRIEELEKKNEDLTQKVCSFQGSDGSLNRKLELTESKDKGGNTMRDKPEDVLTQRVKEMEKIEKQLKRQVRELEEDKEKLIDLSSREKATIHEQNEEIHKLRLSEKALKDQVNNFELSERLLHVKIQKLEDEVNTLEDKLKVMNANEGRYQEILKKYKLDGELNAAKSENMEATVEELSMSETALKKRVQQLEMENSEITGKSESLDKKLKDVEDAKSLLNRHLWEAEQEKKALCDQINAVQQLKGTAQHRNDELAKLNQTLSNKIHKLQEEKAGLVYKLSQSQIQIEELERKLGSVRESELKLQHKVNDLEKCEQGLHKEVKEFRLREIDSQAKLREMDQEVVLLKDQLTKLKHREKTLRYRVQELENANPGSPLSSMSMDLDSSAQFSNYQQKILNLTRENEELKAEMEKRNVLLEKSDNTSLSAEEIRRLQDRVTSSEQSENHCGHEEEIMKLKERLDAYNEMIQRLQKASEIRTEQERDVNTMEITEDMIRPEVHHKADASASQGSKKKAVTGIVPSLSQEDSELIVRSLRNSLSEEEVEEIMQKVVSKHGHPKEKWMVVDDDERWQKIESMNFDPLDDSASEDSHWGKIETAKQLDQSPSRHTRSKGTGHEEIGMDITLLSEQSQNDSDSSAQDLPPANKKTKTVTLFKTKARSNQNSAPPPLPSSLPPSLPSKGAGPIAGLSPVDFTDETADSADEVPDFEEDSEADTSLSAKPAPGLRGDGKGSGEITAGQKAGSLVRRLEDVQKQLTESGKLNANNQLRWKQQAEEKARQLKLSQEDNKNMKEQINKLEQELEEKSRYIEILEALLKALDNIMASRGSKSDEEISQKLVESLEKTKSQVKESGMTSHTGVKDMAALVTDLHIKERDLVSKSNEVSSLKREVEKWRDEYETVEQMRVNALDCLHSLELEVMRLQGSNERLVDLEEKYNKSLQKLNSLEQRCSHLDTVVKEKEICVKEIDALQTKLEDYGKVEGELAVLRGQFEVTEKALKDRLESEKVFQEDNDKLTRKVSELEKDLQEKSNLLTELESLKSRCGDLELEKEQLEKDITSLQSRVEELMKQCQEKDEKIQALSAEMEKLKVKEDKLPLENGCVSSPDISFQDEEIVSSTHRPVENERSSSVSSVSLEGLPARSASVDPTKRRRRMLPTARSITPSPMSNGHSRAREARFESRVTLHLQNINGQSTDPEAKTFVAVANYNPSLFSRSSRPREELKLYEGDTVYVKGEKDDQGYYEAEVNGQKGLVPASYLLPLPVDKDILRSMVERRQQQLQRVPGHLDQSPEHILQLHSELRQSANGVRAAPSNAAPQSPSPIQLTRPKTAPPTTQEGRRRLPQVNGDGSVSPHGLPHTSQTLPRLYKPVAIQPYYRSLTLPKKKTQVFQGPPSPPRDFMVERIVGEHGVMLSWQPPELDEFARSNGSELSGYVIYLNGRVCKKVSSPHLSKVVIENLEVDQSLKFLIQSVAVNGQASSLVEAVWEGDQSHVSDSSFEGCSETDLSSVLSSVQYDQGHKRAFLAIYDYSPMEHSPHDYTGCELGFHAGETITVYGRLRPDGFYHGEIEGKRGLVPASFIEEVPHGVQTKKTISRAHLKLSSQRNH